jgi:hypothetical protein
MSITYETPWVVYRQAQIVNLRIVASPASLTGTYEVWPELPSGLVLDKRKGHITGAATTPTPRDDYEVIATNLDGGCNRPFLKTKVTIQVDTVDYEHKAKEAARAHRCPAHFQAGGSFGRLGDAVLAIARARVGCDVGKLPKLIQFEESKSPPEGEYWLQSKCTGIPFRLLPDLTTKDKHPELDSERGKLLLQVQNLDGITTAQLDRKNRLLLRLTPFGWGHVLLQAEAGAADTEQTYESAAFAQHKEVPVTNLFTHTNTRTHTLTHLLICPGGAAASWQGSRDARQAHSG